MPRPGKGVVERAAGATATAGAVVVAMVVVVVVAMVAAGRGVGGREVVARGTEGSDSD
jgi:hypothetical protein